MKSSKYYLFFLLTIMLGAFLRFFMLTDKSFWFDEGFSLYYSEGSNLKEILTRILDTETGDRFQPLYYLVLFYWRHIFGTTEFAVRSLSALLGVGAVIIIFYTTLQVYGKKHALLSALLMSVSSYAVYYSQQTRAYALLLFLASLQLYLFSKALRETHNDLISRCFFWVVTGFSLFCSTFIAIFSTALCLSHILVYRNPKRWLQWWIPTALFCLPGIYFYLSSPVATEPTKVTVTPSMQPIIQNAFFVLYGLLVGETYGPPLESLRGENKLQVLFNYWPQLSILLIVGITIFVLLVINLRQPREIKSYQYSDNFFALVFAISFLLAFLFALVTKINWLPRHSFYIYVPLTVVLPLVIRSKSKNTRRFQLERAAIIALVILNIYSISNYYFAPKYQREDYRLAARYLLANHSSSVKTVLLWGSPNLLWYYGDPLTLDGTHLTGTNLAQQVSKLTNDADTVVIAVNYQPYWEFKEHVSVEKAMSNLYFMQSKVTLTNFNMYRFVIKRI